MLNALSTAQTSMDTASLNQALSDASSPERKRIREAAEGFEGVFLNTMLQNMFTGLQDGGTWGGGQGSEAWRDMLVNEYAKDISQNGGIGIADSVERELIAIQENQQ